MIWPWIIFSTHWLCANQTDFIKKTDCISMCNQLRFAVHENNKKQEHFQLWLQGGKMLRGTYANSEASDQPACKPSLIRIFTSHEDLHGICDPRSLQRKGHRLTWMFKCCIRQKGLFTWCAQFIHVWSAKVQRVLQIYEVRAQKSTLSLVSDADREIPSWGQTDMSETRLAENWCVSDVPLRYLFNE